MRKKIQLAMVLVFLAGIAGCILKNIEFNTVLKNAVIVEENSTVTLALGGLTVVVLIVSAAFSFFVSKNWSSTSAGISVSKILAVVSAVLMIAGAVMYYLENRNYLLPETIVFVLFALFTGFGVFYMGSGKGPEDGLMRILCVVPSIFCCIWLVLIYKEYATEPQLIKFVYNCLAAAAQTMAFYYISGFFYKRYNRGRGVFACLLGIYFSILVIGTARGIWEMLIIAGLAISIGNCLLGIICRKEDKIQ